MNYRADFHAPFSFISTDIAEMKSGTEEYKNAPESSFQLNFVEEFGFLIDLMTKEKNPSGESCFVFAANFSPETSEKILKFVFCANGKMKALVCEGGKSFELCDFYSQSDVMVSVHDEGWDVIALIPKKTVSEVYGGLDFKPGYQFKANFGKTLEGENAYQIFWSPIGSSVDDPASFGNITLDRSIEAI